MLNNLSILSNRIKTLRKLHGDSQESLGLKINLSRTAISKYETGENEPPVSVLLLICEKYKVSPNWLLGYTTHGSNTASFIKIPIFKDIDLKEISGYDYLESVPSDFLSIFSLISNFYFPSKRINPGDIILFALLDKYNTNDLLLIEHNNLSELYVLLKVNDTLFFIDKNNTIFEFDLSDISILGKVISVTHTI